MSSPYELLAGLALLREKKRLAGHANDKNLESWPALLVRMGDTQFLLRQDDVDEIIVRGKFNRLHGVAKWVIGLGYFRSQLLTILDAALLLKLSGEPQLSDTATRILVVSGEDEWFGLQVNELLGIRHIWFDQMGASAPPENIDQHWLAYVERWIKLEDMTVPVLQVRQLALDLEQNGELMAAL